MTDKGKPKEEKPTEEKPKEKLAESEESPEAKTE